MNRYRDVREVHALKKKKDGNVTPIEEIKMQKLKIFFKRPMLKLVLKVLTMEHGGYRNIKTLRNINRLFTHIDLGKYKSDPELRAYVWSICKLSKLWLDGVITPEIAIELMQTDPEWNELTQIAIKSAQESPDPTPQEAQGLFKLITNALQLGYFVNVRDEYIDLFEGLDPNDVSSLPQIAERLFKISRGILDIRYSTSMISNKVEFNTANLDSVEEGIGKTIDAISGDGSVIRTGIKRWNSMLSPGYMNDMLTVYAGLPGCGKSLVLLKSALDARRYNLGFKTKTPGMRPGVLYVTMENTYEQSIERLWNMCYDEPITMYSKKKATEMICKALGITRVNDKDEEVYNKEDTLRGSENHRVEEIAKPNIEIIMQYYPYRSISTEDLYTIIQDLREEGIEVCMLVFDYIKRIEPSIPIYDNVKMELARIINELKAIAVIYHIPVVTAHQLNRAAAQAVDAAARKGKGDLLKETGRENIGDAWEILETADNLIFLNIEKKPFTEERYMTFAAKKRRRVENTAETSFDYFAHPFSRTNGMRLLDDVDKVGVLSVQSLNSEMNPFTSGEQANAVPRLQIMPREEFKEEVVVVQMPEVVTN